MLEKHLQDRLDQIIAEIEADVELAMNPRCPECGGPVYRRFDKDLHLTGEVYCPSITCHTFTIYQSKEVN